MSTYYKCPSCGNFVKDNIEKDILECNYCNMTITKDQTWYDKTLRFLDKRKSAKEQIKQKQMVQEIKAQKISAWGFIIALSITIILILLSEYNIF